MRDLATIIRDNDEAVRHAREHAEIKSKLFLMTEERDALRRRLDAAIERNTRYVERIEVLEAELATCRAVHRGTARHHRRFAEGPRGR